MSHVFDAHSPLVLSFRADWAKELGIEAAVILDAITRRMRFSAAAQHTVATPVWVFFSDPWIEAEFPFLGADAFHHHVFRLADEEILEFTETQSGPNEIRGLSLTIINPRFYEKTFSAMPAQSTAISGYVYLLYSLAGLYKIGKSIHPERRIRRLEVTLPFTIWAEHIFSADDYSLAERQLHRRFADKRVDGEWFSLAADDVAWIKSIQHFEADTNDFETDSDQESLNR